MRPMSPTHATNVTSKPQEFKRLWIEVGMDLVVVLVHRLSEPRPTLANPRWTTPKVGEEVYVPLVASGCGMCMHV